MQFGCFWLSFSFEQYFNEKVHDVKPPGKTQVISCFSMKYKQETKITTTIITINQQKKKSSEGAAQKLRYNLWSSQSFNQIEMQPTKREREKKTILTTDVNGR